jgi:hypothetical protein
MQSLLDYSTAISTGSLNSPLSAQSQSHIATDGRSVGQSVLVSSPHLGLMTRYLLLFHSYSLVIVGRPLWREDGSLSQLPEILVIYNLVAAPTENTVS